jgi:hypothetical protein
MIMLVRFSPELSVKTLVVTSSGKIVPSFRGLSALLQILRNLTLFQRRSQARVIEVQYPLRPSLQISSSLLPNILHADGFAASILPSGDVSKIASKL